MRLTLLITLAGFAATRLQAQRSAPSIRVEPGTYELTLCHPRCDLRGTRVGHGVLVVVADTLVLPVEDSEQQELREASRWLRLSSSAAPNACFRLTAQREVAGREYYPGIIEAGLIAVREQGGRVEFLLYRSPDASFVVVVRHATPAQFAGAGLQHDWDGSAWEAGEVVGRRIGAADARRCRRG